MKTIMNFQKLKKEYSALNFTIKYIFGCFLFFCCAFVLLKYPDKSANGVKQGIELCLSALIPTLFPFMILSNCVINSGLIHINVPFISKLMNILFRLPGESAPVIFLSMIGGLPVGAKMIQALYEKGSLTKNQSRRMMCFCINSGPAFIISTVGWFMLGSKELGMIIYFSVVTSSLTVGILSRFLAEGTDTYYEDNIKERKLNDNFLHISLVNSSKAMIEICSWVIIFSAISELVGQLNISENTSLFLKCILEITNGSKIACENFSVPVVAGVIGFSGICAHFQLIGTMLKIKMKYKMFLVARIIHGSLSIIYCNLILNKFPIVSETFSAGVRPEKSGTSASVITSLFMILMALLLIIGDDFKLKKQSKN